MNASSATLKLYGSLICPYVQRVRSVLLHLNLPFEYQEVDLFTYENREAWYKAKNPMGTVPTLEIDGVPFNDSGCLIEFLSERENFALHPENLQQRALMRRWNNYFESSLATSFFGIITAHIAKNSEELNTKLDAFRNNIKFLAKHSKLSERAESAFFWGDKLTLTDVLILPHFQSFILVANKLLNINLFADPREEDKEHLEAFENYINRGKKNFEALAKVTFNLETLPPLEKNTVLRDLNVTDVKDFDFENYVITFYKRRFFEKK